MTNFVIVHGAWGGGWEWRSVADTLRGLGHDVVTPTLTGLGDRAHLMIDEPVGLATHVGDIEAVLAQQDERGVVVCAASYGGMPVTGAADRVPKRIRHVIYVDALVPEDGQSALDLLPAWFGESVRAGLAEHGPAWRVPMSDELRETLIPVGSLPDDVRVAYLDRVRDHPAASFAEPIRLTGAINAVPRAFIRCTGADFVAQLGNDPIEPCAERARREGWPYREIATRHDPQLFDPDGLAALLVELAQ